MGRRGSRRRRARGAERGAAQKPPSMGAPHWRQWGIAGGRGVGIDPSTHNPCSRGKHGGSTAHPRFHGHSIANCPHGLAWNFPCAGQHARQACPVADTLPCQGGDWPVLQPHADPAFAMADSESTIIGPISKPRNSWPHDSRVTEATEQATTSTAEIHKRTLRTVRTLDGTGQAITPGTTSSAVLRRNQSTGRRVGR